MVKPSASWRLTPAQVKRRAAKLKLVLTDSDGVLTDTGVYYSEYGEAFKRFSIRDGMGVELLRNEGIETAIITGEHSLSIIRRAEKLKIKRVYLGVRDKLSHLERIRRETGLAIDNMGYIGDDVNDLAMIQAIRSAGLTAAPADAMPTIVKAVNYNCRHTGGNGAFREFADLIVTYRK